MDAVYIKNSDLECAELSIIITLRTARYYNMIERLSYRNTISEQSKKKIEFLVVDYGSTDHEDVALACKQNKFNYVYLPADSGDFNAGIARNVGAQYAIGEYICHEDIDLIVSNKFYYDNLLTQIKIQKLDQDQKKFLSVPVLYLTEEGSEEFLELDENIRQEVFLQYLYENDTSKYVFYMPASSVILVHRYYYLSIGGYNENFNGWGLEDLEYAYRLTREAQQFHTPSDLKKFYTQPEFYKQYKYEGWRSQFRLHGELVGRKGVCLFHIYHPIDRTWRQPKKHSHNKLLFEQSINHFEENGQYLQPIGAISKRSLIFGKGCFVYNNMMRPLWGDLDIKGYEYFDNINIIEYIDANKIDQVIFTNPYANAKRLSVYNKIRASKIPFYVVERGALNDSLFIDPTGFCCESLMYKESYWNTNLTEEKYNNTIKYIQQEREQSDALEKQGERKGVKNVKCELGISNVKKIIFVPLQSRSDTTVNYFSGDIKSFDNFIELVQSLANNLPYDWEIVVKRHPLSKVKENISNVKFADDYHIKDLIELSDYILLMNSGVGVLANIWYKPVIYTAQAFYASDLLNRKAVSYLDVLDIIKSGFKPNPDDCIKFLSYLINDFYCFGKMKTHLSDYGEKSNLTITDSVDIYQLRFNGVTLYKKNINSNKINYNSTLYDIYRDYIQAKILNNNSYPLIKNDINKIKNNKPLIKNGGKKTLNNSAYVEKTIHKKFRKFKRSPMLFFKDMIKNRLKN